MTMRQRLAHIALGGVLVLSGMIASNLLQTSDAQQTASNIVKAREFHLVDALGATTAVIASHPEGLTIQNAAGKAVAAVGTDSDGGSMTIFNAAGKVATSVSDGSNGAGMVVCNAAGKIVAAIGTALEGGVISLENAEGKTGVFVAAGEDGGSLNIEDAKGNGRILLSYYDKMNAGLVQIIGENGSAQITVDEYGGDVSVFGKGSDESRAVMGVNEYGNGAVSTWDKNGYRQH